MTRRVTRALAATSRRWVSAVALGGLMLLGAPAALEALSPQQQSQQAQRKDPDKIGAPETWPMRVEDFLASKHLQRSDILLTRHDYSLSSYIIRRATNSPFSHAAVVFTSPTQEPGISSTFVIEAGTNGVELTNLQDYINDKSGFIAIKRLKQAWWDTEKQSRVRGVLLDSIKSEYNYWAIVRWMRDIWFGVQRTVQGKQKTIESFEKNDWKRPNEFICSGLVQFGFVEAVSEFIQKRQLPPWSLSEVVFSPSAGQWLISRQRWEQMKQELKPADYEALIDNHIPQARITLTSELEAITPEELSRSEKLDWQFVIQNGWVWRIHSREDLARFLK